MIFDFKELVTNFWTGRGGHDPIAIVNHCMGRDAQGNLGTMEGTLSWFRNPKSEVSAHFGIGRDGRVWQFVQMRNTAWANGIVENPDLSIKWLADAVAGGVNPNYLTISIEHEGDGVLPMPEAQFQASLEVHRTICDFYKISADSQHIIRHSQISAIQKANCPGVSFPMARLLKELSTVGKSFTDPVTNLQVLEPFASYYLANGGLPVFGRPITALEPGIALIPPCDKCQWFERARFELHGSIIMLGLVGREAYQAAL